MTTTIYWRSSTFDYSLKPKTDVVCKLYVEKQTREEIGRECRQPPDIFQLAAQGQRNKEATAAKFVLKKLGLIKKVLGIQVTRQKDNARLLVVLYFLVVPFSLFDSFLLHRNTMKRPINPYQCCELCK